MAKGRFDGVKSVSDYLSDAKKSVTDEIKSKAKEGAQQAIPQIKKEVEKEVRRVATPMIKGAIAAGVVGFGMGLIALINSRRR